MLLVLGSSSFVVGQTGEVKPQNKTALPQDMQESKNVAKTNLEQPEAVGQKANEVAKEPLCCFTAKVKWIEMVGKREVNAVPIGTQPELNWLVGIEILSVEKAAKPLEKKGKKVLLIHSPAMMFSSGRPEKEVIGKRYLFKVFGEIKGDLPRFQYAELTAVKKSKKKQKLPPAASTDR